jgi:Glucoamylase and related glycosyl hydrolases
MVGLVGLLEPTDDRFTGTIDAVRRELGHDGFISRYSTDVTDDGLSAARASSLPARSGWSRRSRSTAARPRRGSCSSGCSPCATTWPVRRGVRRRPRPAGRQLPAGIHPPRPDQRRQSPQRRADRDTIRAPRAAAAHADAPQASPGEAEATIATRPAASFCVLGLSRKDSTRHSPRPPRS